MKHLPDTESRRKISSVYDCTADELEQRREATWAEFRRQVADRESLLWQAYGGFPAGLQKEQCFAPAFIYLLFAAAHRAIPGFADLQFSSDLTLAQAAKIMERHRWWPFPNMTVELSLALIEHEHDLSGEAVAQILLAYANNNDSAAIEYMIGQWSDHAFQRRRHIFDDALVAHREGRFALTVPALIPQIEGIIREKLGGVFGVFTWKFEPSFDRFSTEVPALSELPPREHGFYHSTEVDAVYNDVLLRAIGRLFAIFDPREEYIDSELNRNAVCHGRWLAYHTQENSTRCFLLLDALHDLVGKMCAAESKGCCSDAIPL